MTKEEAIDKLYDYSEELKQEEYGYTRYGVPLEDAERIINQIGDGDIKKIIDVVKYVRDRKEPVEFSQEELTKDQETQTYGRCNACQEILCMIDSLQRKGEIDYIGSIL